MTATWRLALRAVAVGLTSFLVQIQGSTAIDAAILKAAIVGGILAALEVLTPLNAVVGLNKTATVHKLPAKK